MSSNYPREFPFGGRGEKDFGIFPKVRG